MNTYNNITKIILKMTIFLIGFCIFWGNVSADEKVDISSFNISGGFNCNGPNYYAKLDLSPNTESIYKYNYGILNKNWCGGHWLWGYKFGGNKCEFKNITFDTDNYYINYICNGHYGISSSAAGGSGGSTNIHYEDSFILSKNNYSLCNYSSEYCDEVQIPTPTNLKQYVKSPLLEKEEISLGSKIGKFQSGSGIIFELEVNNSETKELKIITELNEILSGGSRIFSSNFSNITGKRFFTIPLDAGDYTWKLRLEDNEGNTSEWVEFGNNGTDIDFSIFEGFEPYPYGFSFPNSGPVPGLLTGGVINMPTETNYINFVKVDGTEGSINKWNIFEKAFDTSGLIVKNEYGEIVDDRKMISAFMTFGLHKEPFVNGSCFGLSTLALLKYQDYYFKSKNIPNYLEINHKQLYDKIKNGNIYDLISNPSTGGSIDWNMPSNDLETIFALQLANFSQHSQNLNDAGIPADSNGDFIFNPNEILETLKNNPNKKYILNFEWKENGIKKGHAVVPYRIEGNKIYIWDNISPYNNENNAYNEYVEIKENGKIYISSKANVNENDFTLIGLMDIEEMNNNGKKSTPMGFNNTDTLYTLSGDSDLLITDINGNKTGYKDGEIYQEISGTRIIVNYAGDSFNETWKQIYLQQKLENLTIEINGKQEENYDLMIAGGDYYTKLEGINTNSGQTDIFNISRENIKIDFDDSKSIDNTYNILVDDFQNNGTGSIYLHQLENISNNQNFDIDWNRVINEENDSIKYSIDTNSDGNYDQESYFNSMPKTENETGSIFGYLKGINSPGNSNMAGWKIYIDNNNDGKLQENKELFVVTDNKGYYEFKDLKKGDYTIRIVMKPNWEQIKPTNSYFNVKLNNGQNIVNLDFGNKFLKGNNKK